MRDFVHSRPVWRRRNSAASTESLSFQDLLAGMLYEIADESHLRSAFEATERKVSAFQEGAESCRLSPELAADAVDNVRSHLEVSLQLCHFFSIRCTWGGAFIRCSLAFQISRTFDRPPSAQFGVPNQQCINVDLACTVTDQTQRNRRIKANLHII